MQVGVLDSGVGGLSICDALGSQISGIDLTFCADTDYFPYGTKEREIVHDRVVNLACYLHKKMNFDLLIIACNTASTIVLPALRSQLSCPVVGVVPAVKPAASITTNGVIALLATPATIKRDYTTKLIQEFASDCSVIKVGSGKLVELAEKKLRGAKISSNEIRQELNPIFLAKVKPDTIVLGCTHFPLLAEEISSCLEFPHTLVDSNEAIANRVEDLLGPNPSSQSIKRALFASEIPSNDSFLRYLAKSEFMVDQIVLP